MHLDRTEVDMAANDVQGRTHFPGENVNMVSWVCGQPMAAQERGTNGTS